MGNIQKKLSDYIDKLNAEEKPAEHENPTDSPELEKLARTVRLVRSLKEPALPDADFPRRLSCAVTERLSKEDSVKKPKGARLVWAVAVAAVVVVVFIMNFILPFGKTSIVHAMEKAFQDVKAYHGVLEIVESNAVGEEIIQAKLEVWADKEGHYYVEGLEGPQKGLITVNNGQKKWQTRPHEKQVCIFPTFPDPYRFAFELGREIEEVKNAMETNIIGEDVISGRKTSVIEVLPHGGVPYRIWIDKDTRLPLQRQSSMQNSLQYTVTYTRIDFIDALPKELVSYNLPEGFEEIDKNPEQLVNNIEEAEAIAGFTPKVPKNIPAEYSRHNIAVAGGTKTIKLTYAATAQDKQSKIIILQGKAAGEFKPASTAILGKVNNSVAEIQSPIEGDLGVLAGGGPYSGIMDVSSIRWQEGEFEYAVVGNVSLEKLSLFIKGLTDGVVQIPSGDMKPSNKPQVEVPVDLEVEENEQKSADAGHSPWRLDPAYVAQVFVSLKISPEGIQGEYPVKYEELKIIQNDGKDAIVEVSGDKTPIQRVYLKRLIRQDNTGIWTVVGFDASRHSPGKQVEPIQEFSF
jgi:outer membrane lipoprotein-sorting protein